MSPRPDELDFEVEELSATRKAIAERRDVLLQVMKDMRHFVK